MFYFNDVWEQLKTAIDANFCSEWVLGFVIDYAWISKLYMTAEFVEKWLISGLNSGKLAIWTVLVLEKVFVCEFLESKSQWQMFLLVSGRHDGAYPEGHHHGVSIQISINLGGKLLRISCVRKIAVTWILATLFAVLIFILIYFKWRDTENQRFEDL